VYFSSGTLGFNELSISLGTLMFNEMSISSETLMFNIVSIRADILVTHLCLTTQSEPTHYLCLMKFQSKQTHLCLTTCSIAVCQEPDLLLANVTFFIQSLVLVNHSRFCFFFAVTLSRADSRAICTHLAARFILRI